MITTKDFCINEYGRRLYKISFDAGMGCPNRDGRIGTRGCIFCSEGGSGENAVKIDSKVLADPNLLEERIAAAKSKVADKYKGDGYIAYFQAYTNTYADTDTLRKIYLRVIEREDISVLSIATRPDCLDEEKYALLEELNSVKPVWVELGLQTTKESSVQFIRRGYGNEVYDEAVKRLNQIGIHTISHIILYLPGESREDMKESVRHAVAAGTKGIKLQMLQVLKNTDLAVEYEKEHFYLPELTEYAEMIKECVAICPEDMVFHRLTGDPPRKLLIEPRWVLNKKEVINTIKDTLNPQGPYYIYILKCGDGSLYTGSTNDVNKRFNKHSKGKGCKYTASHLPVELVYIEEYKTKREALVREYEIKQLKREEKLALINSRR